MTTYPLTIVSPQGKIFQDQVIGVSAPGSEGSFGILAGHVPMITQLKNGPLQITMGQGETRKFTIDSGILEVTDQHQVLILVDNATTPAV